MANWDDLKQTFFEETKEGLEAIDAGLTDIRDGSESDDTVNAVFRAIHSAKGGAGVFGFEDLVRFAHVFETVLDAVRHGTLSPSPDVLDVLFTASDVLSDFVAMARSGEPAPAGYGDECRAALEGLLGQGEGGGAEEPAEDFDIPFVPVMVDDFDSPAEAAGERCFTISFRPTPAFPADQDPLFLLQQLRSLGTLELAAQTDALPSLAELSLDLGYIGWSGTLRTAWGREDIERVFAFVADKCELEITEVSVPPADGDLAGVGDAAAGLPDLAPAAAARPPRRAPMRSPRWTRSPPNLRPRSRRYPSSRPSLLRLSCPTRRRCRPGRRRAAAGRARSGRGSPQGGPRPGRFVRRHHHPGGAREDRPRRQHGRRDRHRPGDAGPGRAGAPARDHEPGGAADRGRLPPYPRAQGQRDVHARPAGEDRVPAHDPPGPRARHQDRQEGPAGDAGREHRGRQDRDRAAERPDHPHHPQLDRSWHRIARGAAGGRQEGGRHDPARGRAARRPHRHRDHRRRGRNQFRTRAEEGAREGPGRRRRGAQQRRDQQSDLPAGLLDRRGGFRPFRPRRRHGRGATKHPGSRRPHHAQIRARARHVHRARLAAHARRSWTA